MAFEDLHTYSEMGRDLRKGMAGLAEARQEDRVAGSLPGEETPQRWDGERVGIKTERQMILSSAAWSTHLVRPRGRKRNNRQRRRENNQGGGRGDNKREGQGEQKGATSNGPKRDPRNTRAGSGQKRCWENAKKRLARPRTRQSMRAKGGGGTGEREGGLGELPRNRATNRQNQA